MKTVLPYDLCFSRLEHMNPLILSILKLFFSYKIPVFHVSSFL